MNTLHDLLSDYSNVSLNSFGLRRFSLAGMSGRFFDAPKWARNKKRKAERAAARALKRSGISGAGLWRKTGKRSVRGW